MAARTNRGRPHVASVAGILLAGLIALLATSSDAAAARSTPADFYGVVTQSQPLGAAEADRMRRGGVGAVRFHVPWTQVERVRGHYEWATVDRRVARIARAGARPIPFVFGSPRWFATEPTPPLGRPAIERAWSDFLEALVRRYGPGGSFVTGRGIEPIEAWQIWNEPNLAAFWGDREPDADAYVELLGASSAAIHAVDPGAEIILAGLSPANRGVAPHLYLRQLYERYRELDVKPGFDQLALHPYAGRIREVRRQVRAARRVARRATGSVPPTLIAEVGWGSAGPRHHPLSGSPRWQGRRLNRLFRMFERHRRDWRITGVMWFAWRDLPSEAPACSFCTVTGLLDERGETKRAWRVFKRVRRQSGRSRAG